jgi:hypothetical protein
MLIATVLMEAPVLRRSASLASDVAPTPAGDGA